MEVRKKKEFRLFDAVLAAVCIVLVVEAAAPAAAIGPMQYLWWAIMLIAFFLPYGMISAELGTAYDDEGGIYDWVKRAFGRRTGSRVAWYYWVNFPLWMASLAVIFTDIFAAGTGIEIPWGGALAVQLIFIWFVILISNYRVSQSKWLINIGTFVKVALMVMIGVLGIVGAVRQGGVASSSVDISPLMGLSFVSIILFNFMGFEVVATFAGDMKNPKKEIPKAIVLGGILIAIFYLFAAFGIGVAIPADQLSVDSGFMDAMALLLGTPQGAVMVIVALMFMFTLVANLASWSFGVNYVAMYAARDHAMPKVFEKENKQEVPSSSNILNGVIASVIVVIATVIGVMGGDLDTFWTLFALNVVTLLASYIFMFPAFLKLRKTDPDRERPYKVPGKKGMLAIMTFVPLILLILAIVFSMFPFNEETGMLEPDWVLIIGVLIAVVLGEIIAAMSAAKAKRLGLPDKEVLGEAGAAEEGKE